MHNNWSFCISEYTCLLGWLSDPCCRHIYVCSASTDPICGLYCNYAVSGREHRILHDHQFQQEGSILKPPVMIACNCESSHWQFHLLTFINMDWVNLPCYFQVLPNSVACWYCLPRMILSRNHLEIKLIIMRFEHGSTG